MIVMFLVPLPMVAAELGTAWCKDGGIGRFQVGMSDAEPLPCAPGR